MSPFRDCACITRAIAHVVEHKPQNPTVAYHCPITLVFPKGQNPNEDHFFYFKLYSRGIESAGESKANELDNQCKLTTYSEYSP